jgi:hypothetical protein
MNIYAHGNKCGHNPLLPRHYSPPIDHKRRKPFLEKAGARIGEAFDEILKYDIAHLFYHSDKIKKSGGYRQVRSDKREALTTRVGRCILHHVNLGAMVLGFFVVKRNDFHYFDYSYIAKEVGASLSQVKRAMATYIKAGYIEVEQRKVRGFDGKAKSIAPIIRVNERLLIDLGFDPVEVRFHVERGEKALAKDKAKASREAKPIPPLYTGHEKKRRKKVAKSFMTKILSELASKLKPNTS